MGADPSAAGKRGNEVRAKRRAEGGRAVPLVRPDHPFRDKIGVWRRLYGLGLRVGL